MSVISGSLMVRYSIKEELTAAEAQFSNNAANRDMSYNGIDTTLALSSTTTPKLEQPPVGDVITLGGGITSIDLAAVKLARDSGQTLDLSSVPSGGKKLIGFGIEAGSANVNDVTVAPGAANPFPLFGTGNSIKVPRGMKIYVFFDGLVSTYADVAAGVKQIDISSGNAGDTFKYFMLFGT